MDFSVVIPLYNKGPHIEAAVASVLAQTLPPREIVVVDDGSSDDGLVRVRAIDDPRIRIFTRSPPGPGGYAARNLGVEHAQGDWIAFLDADDLWRAHHLADLAAAIAACGKPVDCAFSNFEIRRAGQGRLYPIDGRAIVPNRALDMAAIIRGWLATERCPLWTGGIAMRRDALLAAGLFPAGRTRRGGDKDLWLRVISRADSVFAAPVSAEFHQDTVNRVTTSTGHEALPILVETIRSLLPAADARTQGLLRRLSNQEVVLYARHAAGARARTGTDYLRAIYFPEGLRVAAPMIAYMAAQRIRRLTTRTKKGGR